MVVNLQRRVRIDASEANDVVAVVVELDEPVSNNVVRQTDIVHDEHAAVHLHRSATAHTSVAQSSEAEPAPSPSPLLSVDSMDQGCKRDLTLRDRDETETETFFETFNLQDCAKTMNGDVQIKTTGI